MDYQCKKGRGTYGEITLGMKKNTIIAFLHNGIDFALQYRPIDLYCIVWTIWPIQKALHHM